MELRQTAQLEELERQKIALRRQQHAERLKRIMNEREREIGLDVEFLQKQIEEKKAREAAEKAEEEEYQRRFLEEQRIAAGLARQEEKTRRQIQQEDIEFNMKYLTKDKRREADIEFAPLEPARRTDNDPWLTVSGGQKFEGEDLGSVDRAKRQREQLLRWQKEQMAEIENRKAQELAEDREWQRRYIENDRIMQENAQREHEARLQWRDEINAENERLAREKREREEAEKRADLEFNQAEIQRTNASAFMSESRQQAVGVNGKCITQDWKGMTDEQKLAIIEERRQQKLEAERLRQEKIAQEQREEAERMRIAKEAIKAERAEQRRRKQELRNLADEYQKEAVTQKEMETMRNTEIYGTNQPTDDFWSYFGKSHR